VPSFQAQYAQSYAIDFAMSAQASLFQNLMQQRFGSPQVSKRFLMWGGAGLIVAGYGVTHLPNPLELLGWAGAVGVGLWSVRRLGRGSNASSQLMPQSLTVESFKQAIAQTKTQLEQLASEASDGPSLRERYTTQLAEIEQSLNRQTLELQIVGTRAVGKTALRQLLVQQSHDLLQQGWCFAESDEIAAEGIQDACANTAQTDVALFVVQGDLTQAEWGALQQLQQLHKRVLLLLNKHDRYLPAQAELLLEQLKQRVQGIVAAEDVMAIATCPQPLKVRRYRAEGAYEETWETPPPQIQPLLQRLQTVAAQDVKQLVLQRAYQQTTILQTKIQTALNQIRRDRALPQIERYQWIAAGAAFANPLPSLDMVATAAITGKMIQDLAKVYQIQLSLDRATEIASVLAKMLIQMGLVEASSQLLSSLLKGNAATYVVGGTLQGVGAAYFTRMAGLSLVELFEVYRETEMGWKFDSAALGQIVQRVFGQHRKIEVCKDLVQQTLRRLKPEGETAFVSA
jgi:uncharacterized protein